MTERCWLLRDSRPLRATTDEAEAARLPGIGVAIEGPFVPAEQLQGAVSAMREALDALDPDGGARRESDITHARETLARAIGGAVGA